MERLSIGEVVRRLGATGTVTASGKPYWDRSTVWGILQNPAYMGRAAFGKTQARDRLPRIRAQRHSAEVSRKGYSTVRTDPSQWIEIAVPAIVSEGLFQSVQEQLAENRKATRQRRHGAVYLLQGLTVCGHCHYAYYGKKVSKAAAKVQRRDYAYYRCIGTDAYRFGGERVCDNQQIRTDRLDELVWQQVVELLAHPGRLKNEYERRLGILEEKEKTNLDTAALERQRLQLDKGRSRLIDSYAEGMIDKMDFDPKMRHLKSRLEQLDQQIQDSRRHQVGQRELFLVINRLEEFAAAVHDRLGTVDFVTKREIIRGLVKRVEIHKDEILVVFRVDPDPGFNASETSTGSGTREKSMQDRTRRNHCALGSSLGRSHPTAILHYSRLKPFTDESEHASVCNPMPQKHQHPFMVDLIKGNHDRLPLSTTLLNRSSSRERVTRSKANASRSLTEGSAPDDCTFY
ncbi:MULTISPECIES: recombinase family protein [Pseudomonas]